MSWLPVYHSWVILLAIVSIFFWKLLGVCFFLFVVVLSIYPSVRGLVLSEKHFASGFWLFLLTEVFAFGTLFVLCTLTEEECDIPLSPFMELPFLGCFMLTSSSMTVTAYHHSLGTGNSWLYLVATIILGSCFIALQMYEFYECDCDLTYCSYQACCFCTVGLHFMHVLGGLVALSVLLWLGGDNIPRQNLDYVVWYWHFVDYIWLLVFLVVYLS